MDHFLGKEWKECSSLVIVWRDNDRWNSSNKLCPRPVYSWPSRIFSTVGNENGKRRRIVPGSVAGKKAPAVLDAEDLCKSRKRVTKDGVNYSVTRGSQPRSLSLSPLSLSLAPSPSLARLRAFKVIGTIKIIGKISSVRNIILSWRLNRLWCQLVEHDTEKCRIWSVFERIVLDYLFMHLFMYLFIFRFGSLENYFYKALENFFSSILWLKLIFTILNNVWID